MPKVGNKHFAYTKAGYAAAAKESKRTGKPLILPRRKSPSQRGK